MMMFATTMMAAIHIPTNNIVIYFYHSIEKCFTANICNLTGNIVLDEIAQQQRYRKLNNNFHCLLQFFYLSSSFPLIIYEQS